MLRLANVSPPAHPADGEKGNPGATAGLSSPSPAGTDRSAFLREVLFLVLLAGSVLLFGNFTVVRTVMEPRTELMGLALAGEIGAVHDAAVRLPPPQRLPWIREVVGASRGGLAVVPQGPGMMRPPANPVQAEALQVIQQRLPRVVIGLVDGDPPRLWFAVPGNGGELIWLTLPVGTAADPTGMMLAAWGSEGVLVVLASVLVIGWRQQLRVRRASEDLARIEGACPHGGQAPSAATSSFAASVPVDLPATDSLEDLVRVMSARMEGMDKRRDDALDEAAREVQAVTGEGLPVSGRIASQFKAYAQREALAREPAQQVDLNALVQRATADAPFGVVLGLAPVPPLSLRPAAIECLLDNLLRNALSYGAGQVVLTTAEEGDWVVLRVMDRGEPLAEEELAMVGRPFYRTEAARASGAGAGLGLALATQVAQAHGGDLRVSRRSGGGLAVEVRLPVPQEGTAGSAQPPARHRRSPAWMGLLGDVALLAVLYVGALAVGLSLLARTVMEPNLQASTRVWVSFLGGIAAAHQTLPAQARPAYLQDLQAHSRGAIHAADPAAFKIAEPVMLTPRTILQAMRSARPDLALMTSPLPDPALWLQMPSGDGQPPGPWVRMNAPLYSSDMLTVFVGLTMLVAASAAFLALRARRRLDRAAQALRRGQAEFQAQAREHGGTQALVDGLADVRERFERVCERLAQARYEQEVLLGRVLQDLRVSIEGTRQPGTMAGEGRLQEALDGLAQLAQAADDGNCGLAQVNELLCELQAGLAAAGRPLLGWTPAEVPAVALGKEEARLMLGAIVDYLLSQGQEPPAVSSVVENGWVVVRFSGQGARIEAGAAAQGLALTCRMVESHAGFMRFGQAPGGGVHVEMLLPAARRPAGQERAGP